MTQKRKTEIDPPFEGGFTRDDGFEIDREQWAGMLVDFETMVRVIDADEKRERREMIQEQWAEWLVAAACVEPDAPPAFREFVDEQAERWASGFPSPDYLASWLDRTHGHGFYDRVRADYAEHLAEQQRESDERDEAFRKADPRRANQAAMRATDTPAIRAVCDWKADERPILVLFGPKGIGKTVAACHHAYAIAQLRWPPTFVRASEYVRLSKFDGARDFALDAPYLIVDDVGGEFLDSKGSAAADFDELFDRFYSDPTRRLIITSNLSPDAFARQFGPRVADRLREAGEIAALSGRSLRGGRE